MDFNEIIRDIKNKIFHPVYLLTGDEPYYIDKIEEALENNVLNEAEKSFNQTIFYGKETQFTDVIDSARRYPMFANYQLIIVREAQEMKGIDKLLPYVEKPLKSTVLVLCFKYKNLDKRTSFYKSLNKHGVVFQSKKLYDNKIPDWISQLVGSKGYSIAPQAARLMVEYLGNDLSRIEKELDKLFISIKEGETIDVKLVEQNTGISKDYNVFELQNALISNNPEKAGRIVNHFIANPKAGPMPLIMGSLYNFFSKVYLLSSFSGKNDRELASLLKVNPYFIKDYKQALRVYNRSRLDKVMRLLLIYDLRSKGVNDTGTPQGELLREMVFRIMH